MWNMNGKVAIITGSGNGIGRATARLFAREGAKVVVVDVEREPAAETVRLIEEEGGAATLSLADVSIGRAVEAMAGETLEQFGRIDILHANAAVQITEPIGETGEDEWDRLHVVNLKGAFLCAKAVLPAMQRERQGAIIITSSGHAFATHPNSTAYASTKGGQLAFMRALALDCAPYGIRVNCVIPGATDTRLLRGFIDAADDPKTAEQRLLETIPMRRFARPEDIANAVLFLASDYASYITGTSLAVDGGLLAQA
jgi:NAD(P)-dependent dehydrogenase (short-subunit alcohol dehydrogenase family)